MNAVNHGLCDNGAFCDGSETCDAALDCQAGAAPATDDSIGCTDDSCDEDNDVIVNAVNHGSCDNNLFCDGSETCDAALDCQAGTAPATDDSIGCTDDSCDEDNDRQRHRERSLLRRATPMPGGRGAGHRRHGRQLRRQTTASFCDGSETCDAALDCQAGTAPATDDSIGCTDDSCDEDNDVIVNAVNHGLCDNGAFCDGSETCDAALDCQAGIDPVASDGISCTADSCDEVNDVIVNAVDHGYCDDGNECTTDTCSAATSCTNEPILECSVEEVPAASPWTDALIVALLLGTALVTFRRRHPATLTRS